MASAVEPARVQSARIDAFLVPAGLVVRAVGILPALCSRRYLDVRHRALHPRITVEAARARAHGFVIDRLADGVETAGADARVSTSLRVTRSVPRTIGVQNTLGIDTEGRSVSHSALAVRVAGTRIAWVGF